MKILGFLTDWRNGLALLIAAAVVIWLMQDGSLPVGSMIVIFIAALVVVYLITGVWTLLTKRKTTPPA